MWQRRIVSSHSHSVSYIPNKPLSSCVFSRRLRPICPLRHEDSWSAWRPEKRQNKTFICKGIEATGHPVLLYLSWQDHFWFTVYKNGSFFLVKRSRKVCLLSPSTLRHSYTIGLFLLQRQFPCSLPSPRRKKSNQLHLAQKWQRDKRSRVHSFSSTLHITLIWHIFCSSPNRWLCRVWNKAPRSAQ